MRTLEIGFGMGHPAYRCPAPDRSGLLSQIPCRSQAQGTETIESDGFRPEDVNVSAGDPTLNFRISSEILARLALQWRWKCHVTGVRGQSRNQTGVPLGTPVTTASSCLFARIIASLSSTFWSCADARRTVRVLARPRSIRRRCFRAIIRYHWPA